MNFVKNKFFLKVQWNHLRSADNGRLTKRFSGLTSRWTMLSEWRYVRADAKSCVIRLASGSLNLPAAAMASNKSPPLREKIGNSLGVSHAAAHYCATVPKRHTTHFDQLQDQAEDASGVDDVVQFDDVRVPQSTQYLHFTFQHNFFALSFR